MEEEKDILGAEGKRKPCEGSMPGLFKVLGEVQSGWSRMRKGEWEGVSHGWYPMLIYQNWGHVRETGQVLPWEHLTILPLSPRVPVREAQIIFFLTFLKRLF